MLLNGAAKQKVHPDWFDHRAPFIFEEARSGAVPIVWQPTTAPQQVKQFVYTTRVVVLEAHNIKKNQNTSS